MFSRSTAQAVDRALGWEDAVSFSFLYFDKSYALQVCSVLEANERNVVMEDGGGVFTLTFDHLSRKGSTAWPSSIFQVFWLIGLKSLLYYEFCLELEDIKRLEDCSQVRANKRLLFLLMESLETEDQLKLSVSLSSYVPALEAPVKTLETLFLHLMSSRSTGEICSILMRGLNTMARPDLVSQFRGMACDSSDCEVHLTRPRPSLPYYQSGPGLCVIINQKLFSCPDLQDRLGSDKDVESLKKTFTMLGVAEQDFLLLQNVTDTEMMSGLERAAEMSGRADLAWVAVVVLSHGKRVQGWDLVMGVNGKGVDRTDIQEKFSDSSCPNLTGKPKLFFYQACRDEGEESEKIDQKSRPVRQAVGSSDVFSYSSTTPGFLSYRHTQDGSFFIQCLCHVLQDNAQLEDLDNLVKRVNRQLRELEPPSQPEYSSTMSRQFKFQVTTENKIRAAQQIRVSVFDRNLNDFVQNYNQTTM